MTQSAPAPHAHKTHSHWPVSILSTLSSLVNMLLPLVLVRLLKPEEIGLFKIFFLYITIFPAFSFMTGVFSGLPYWAGQPKEGPAALRMSSLLALLSAVFLFAATWALRVRIAAFLGWQVAYVEVLSAGLLATLASSFFEEVAIAMGRIWTGALFSSGLDLLRTLMILVAAVTTRSLLWIFIAHVSVHLFKTIVGYGLGYREGWVGFGWNTRVFRDVWKYALPVSIAWGFGVLVSYSDQMILSKYISSADFAFYSIGCLTVPPLIILEASIARVLIPQLSAAFALGQGDRAARLFRKAVADLSYLTIPAVAGMAIFAGPIIELLFTSRYASAAGYMRAYSLFYLVQILPHDSVPRARGEGSWILGNFISFAVLTLGACWGLTLGFGPWGALTGLVATRAAMKLYSMIYIRRTTHWRWSEFLPLAEGGRSLAVCLALGGVCLGLKPLFGDHGLSWFLSCGGGFSLAYFALTLGWAHWLDRRQITEPKVMMLTQHLGIGGLERMILNLSVQLKAQSQWRPEVFVYDHLAHLSIESNLVGAFAAQGIPVDIYAKKKGFSAAAVLKIAKTVLDRKIQVIHSHDLGALIYGVCAKLLLFGRVRLVHTQHSFVHVKRLKRYAYYERIFTFFADDLSVVSADTRGTYVELGVPARKIQVIPNGVAFTPDPAPDAAAKQARRDRCVADCPPLGALSDSSWLLYLARIHGRKGQDHAVALWSRLPQTLRSRSALVFVGPETESGRLAELERLIAAAPDRARIVVAGPAQNPLQWLEASDVYLSCSEFEGMPLGPIEAAGAGLPLLLSAIPGHQMLAGKSHVYDLADPVAGARALEAALEQGATPPGRAQLLETACAIRAEYSLGQMASRYQALYGKHWRKPADGRLARAVPGGLPC